MDTDQLNHDKQSLYIKKRLLKLVNLKNFYKSRGPNYEIYSIF